MNINKIFLVSCMLLTVFSGCKKYLNIQPEDQYTEDQVFSNEASIQQALNGIYIRLADDALYGLQLTQYAVEYLGQRYTVSDNSSSQRFLQQYDYANPASSAIIESIWGSAYQTILKVNNFLEKLPPAKARGVIPSAKADQLYGEALGIRSLIYFDLLRLFGPVYAATPQGISIPYYNHAKAAIQPLAPASAVLDSVISNWNAALVFLQQDPVITKGAAAAGSFNFYSSLRNKRMNYYAVKGLLARAYLYQGNTQKANQLAKEVLSEGEKWFEWLPYTSIRNAGKNPDRVFSTEVLFGSDNRNLYNLFNEYYNSSLDYPVTADNSRLALTFENNINDYRYQTTWLGNSNNQFTFSKYADIQDQSKNWRFLQPILRKSELYYIIAETSADPDQGLTWLNTVRFNRGLTSLTTSANLQAELQKEYQKEFYGEGQLFFYYKRKKIQSIPSGISSSASVQPQYVVPLPEAETRLR